MKLNNFKGKEKIMLWNTYYQKGLNITSQLKYFVLAFAGADILTTKDYRLSFVLIAAYLVFTFIAGYFWTRWLYETEIEVSNKFNKFVREMRRKIR